jgi:hypothetical protein
MMIYRNGQRKTATRTALPDIIAMVNRHGNEDDEDIDIGTGLGLDKTNAGKCYMQVHLERYKNTQNSKIRIPSQVLR